MKTETIKILEKPQIKSEVNKEVPTSGCCGGPVTDVEACCKLDEEKKAAGGSGCSCNTSPRIKTHSGCC